MAWGWYPALILASRHFQPEIGQLWISHCLRPLIVTDPRGLKIKEIFCWKNMCGFLCSAPIIAPNMYILGIKLLEIIDARHPFNIGLSTTRSNLCLVQVDRHWAPSLDVYKPIINANGCTQYLSHKSSKWKGGPKLVHQDILHFDKILVTQKHGLEFQTFMLGVFFVCISAFPSIIMDSKQPC